MFADGAVFEGDFKAGKPEGRVIYRSADGAVYEGATREFKADKRDHDETNRSLNRSLCTAYPFGCPLRRRPLRRRPLCWRLWRR